MDIEGAYVTGKEEIVLNGHTLYVNEIGFLQSQNIAVNASREGANGLALLVAECVTDKDGNKFTYDEVCRLKKEFAEPLFEAVIKMQGIGEKN